MANVAAVDEELSHKFTFPGEILPDNERTAHILKQRAEEEEVRRQRAEELKAMKEKEERAKRMRDRALKDQEAKQQRLARENEMKKKEAEEEKSKLVGKMYTMLCELQENKTPFEYTLSGLDLGSTRCRILFESIAFNSTLLSIHLARKRISDVDGQVIARMLYTNKTLRKIELEGNQLGPKSAAEFGKSLKKNTTLKYLDLESNQMTADGHDLWGVYEFVEFLGENKTLLGLNVANNGLDEKCGTMFRQQMEGNTTLINFEFHSNNFNIEDSHGLQDSLMRNKKDYDLQRLQEWKERKLMRAEDEDLQAIYLAERTEKEKKLMEEEAHMIRESELNEKWKKYMLETEIEKQQIIQQLTEAAVLRQSKGKGKKGKKKKK